jgi:hypothetical protein
MTLFLCNFFTMLPICFYYYYEACNWSIGYLQVVNISKSHHMLKSNHSIFCVQSFQVSYPYKVSILKMQTFLFTENM